MFIIGCHLPIGDGYAAAANTALSIGANTFQYFSRNPQGGARRAVDVGDIESFKAIAAREGIYKILAHAPYTLNPCSANPATRGVTKVCMKQDLETLRLFGGGLYNFHPGSHTGQGADIAIEYIAECLNAVLSGNEPSVVLLETMSGKGSEVGGTFDELKRIIGRVERSEKLGVLIDTCHIYSAGYDIVNNLDGVLEQFDKAVGLSRLKGIHLNDSMTPFNGKKDRHERIGEGTIGLDALARVTNHRALRALPFYLETPNELSGYEKEIALLKGLQN
jgi:deoxyribonuclease-4